MLVFITAVRHPQNSKSFSRVGRLLDRTLHSVCRQSDDRFSVVVVHNSLPNLTVRDPRISYLRVGFPPPSSERTAEIDFIAGVRDKGTKLSVGLAAARDMGAEHVMFIDCDDLLSCNIADWANQHPGHPGWFSPDGYIHTVGSRQIQPVSGDFHHLNGSSSIVRTDLTGLASGVSPTSTQEEVVAAMGQTYVDRVIGIHGRWADLLAEDGHQMEALPFRSTIWEIGTGENASGNLVSARTKVTIAPGITHEFGLRRPPLALSQLRDVAMLGRRVARRVNTDRRRSHREAEQE